MPPARYRYQTLEFPEFDIHLRTLRDKQQFFDPHQEAEKLGISSAAWSLAGVLWPAGQVLAHHLQSLDTAGLRILEIGCGVGLASLVLNHQRADISATDQHPACGPSLARNAALNEDPEIRFERLAWEDGASVLGTFDLVIGSDILYEASHVELVCAFVVAHCEPRCTVILVDPGRGHHARFSKRMVALGFAHEQHPPDMDALLDRPFKGQILRYCRG